MLVILPGKNLWHVKRFCCGLTYQSNIFLKAHFLREKISRLFFHMHAQKVEVGSLVNFFEMRHGLVTSSQSQGTLWNSLTEALFSLEKFRENTSD